MFIYTFLYIMNKKIFQHEVMNPLPPPNEIFSGHGLDPNIRLYVHLFY